MQETLSTVDISSVEQPPAMRGLPVVADSSSIPLLRQSVDSVTNSEASSLGDDSDVAERDLLLDAVREGDIGKLQALIDEGYEQPIPLQADAEWHTPLSLAYHLNKMCVLENLVSSPISLFPKCISRCFCDDRKVAAPV